ncbi:hypothetical protein HMPREF0972_01780 [Actinomyces sp. oral taxon 848 str. F0332]|nr:hypothetical protein HMPREF0972_01780 [Actinomyces sp. oral taxon 848 str. F0332]
MEGLSRRERPAWKTHRAGNLHRKHVVPESESGLGKRPRKTNWKAGREPR